MEAVQDYVSRTYITVGNVGVKFSSVFEMQGKISVWRTVLTIFESEIE